MTTDYQDFRFKLVIGYHFLALFRTLIGYRLPLVMKFDNLELVTVGYHLAHMSLVMVTIGNQSALLCSLTGYQRVPKNKIVFCNRPVTMVTRLTGNRTC